MQVASIHSSLFANYILHHRVCLMHDLRLLSEKQMDQDQLFADASVTPGNVFASAR